MTILSLSLSVAAFVYLAYIMRRRDVAAHVCHRRAPEGAAAQSRRHRQYGADARNRLTAGDRMDKVPAASLRMNDVVMVHAGEFIPGRRRDHRGRRVS